MEDEMPRREITGKKPAQTTDEAKRQAGPPKKVDPKAIEPAAKSEPDSPARSKATPIRGPPVLPAAVLAFSIKQFCAAHGVSEAMFFKLVRQGEGPALMKVGRRTLVSIESAERWRREREAATSATATEAA
jgi:hypothetical protein